MLGRRLGVLMEYIFLAIAILFEIIASSLLKATQGFTRVLPSMGCIICYCICFYLFSKSLLKLDLGIAYALWCGIGIVATTVISILFFEQKLNVVGWISIAMILIGCVLLNLQGGH